MTRPGSRTARGAAAVVVIVVSLVACSSAHPPRPTEPLGRSSTTTRTRPAPGTDGTSAPLTWRSCSQGECATMRVPLDSAAPAGRQIDLAVARASRAKSGQKIGSLLVNPGGPGAPGLEIVEYVAAQLPRAITDRFDIVAWDPRGTGRSDPVQCGDRLDYLFDADTAPDTPAELAALESASRRFVDDCVAKSGDQLRHISTADTVRDLDRLRAALGDEKLTFLGLSYGTVIGGLYAQEYPDRVRALVLDGAVDPALPVETVAIQQAQGFGASLNAFFSWCRSHSECRFHHADDPRRAYDRLKAKIDAHPLTDDSGVFGPSQLDIAVAALLYGGESGYRSLGDGLHELEGGGTTTLRPAFDEYMGRHDGRYDSEWAAFVAISCADGPNLTLPETEALQRRAAVEAPDFGAANVGLGYECAYWPFPPTHTTPTTFSAPTAPPIVVVGTSGDPATPVAWAAGLARQLGSGRLVTVTGTTHTASLNGNPCLDEILTRYLVDRVAPKDGTHCAAGP